MKVIECHRKIKRSPKKTKFYTFGSCLSWLLFGNQLHDLFLNFARFYFVSKWRSQWCLSNKYPTSFVQTHTLLRPFGLFLELARVSGKGETRIETSCKIIFQKLEELVLFFISQEFQQEWREKMANSANDADEMNGRELTVV